jgi:hypothetical protein
MRNKVLLFGIFLMTMLHSCQKDPVSPDSLDLGLDYFPLKSGSSLVYEVDSILYDGFNQTVDTIKSIFTLEYHGEFVDSTGENAFRIERFNPNLPQVNQNNRIAYYVKKDHQLFSDFIDNKKTVKLSFPVRNGRFWDANSFNTDNFKRCTYQLVGEKFKGKFFEFDQTATVSIYDIQTFISEIKQVEVYAKNIGLVFSEDTFIERNSGRTNGYKIIIHLKEIL